MSKPYRTLFLGTLVQESFLSVGGVEDPTATVDSPFCRDGLGRPTLRGSGLAGALIATSRRCLGKPVPASISGSDDGREPSVWRFFNGHRLDENGRPAYRQHVEIDARTGAAATGALFNVETLPPGTRWRFMLEVDTHRFAEAAGLAREALSHWATGRCLLGRDVARGLGWMRLEDPTEYTLMSEDLDIWPCSRESDDYPSYLRDQFGARGTPVPAATSALPGWMEITGSVTAGEREDGYGIDSLSIGGHASEELSAQWDNRYFAPEGANDAASLFDPDLAIVTMEVVDGGEVKRVPYVPGSSLRGPLRHALARSLRAGGETDLGVVDSLFGTTKKSAMLLIRDALPDDGAQRLAWFQHHAEDEFTAGAYEAAKFDRVAVMQGSFVWRMVLEDADQTEQDALRGLLQRAELGQIGIGGGQWRGHGWMRWSVNKDVTWGDTP